MTDPQTIVEGLEMKEDVRVPTAPGLRGFAPEPPTASQPEALVPSRGFMLKCYKVAVDGFPAYPYFAASRGRALRDSWRAYTSYRQVLFGEFLKIARAWEEKASDSRFGLPITVEGKPAFFVTSNNQYVQFSRPFGLEYFNAHPYDVEPEHMRPWTYRDSDASLAEKPQALSPEGVAARAEGIAKEQP